MVDENVLLNQICADMGIRPFGGEKEAAFASRVVYAAMGAWVRTCLSGRTFSDFESEAIGVDVHHIIARCTQTLVGFMNVLPLDIQWFMDGKTTVNDIESIARKSILHIIRRLYIAKEIVRLKNRCFVAPPVRLATNDKGMIICLGGLISLPKGRNDPMYAGLGRWVVAPLAGEKVISIEKAFNIPEQEAGEWIKSIIKGVQWSIDDIPQGSIMFQAGSGKWHKYAWQSMGLEAIDGIALIRTRTGLYRLLKKEGGALYIANLDYWYSYFQEIRRIQFALDLLAGNPSVFEYEDLGDRILLHVHSRLPNGEMALIMLSGWPYRGIDDEYFWIIPKPLWPVVRVCLAHAGIICLQKSWRG